jgi:hypothetical protein
LQNNHLKNRLEYAQKGQNQPKGRKQGNSTLAGRKQSKQPKGRKQDIPRMETEKKCVSEPAAKSRLFYYWLYH